MSAVRLKESEARLLKCEGHSTFGPTAERYYTCLFSDGSSGKFVVGEIEQKYAYALALIESYDALHVEGEDSDTEVQWEVERITAFDAATNRFKVKWKSYGEEYEDTWEPFENIEDCKEALSAFQHTANGRDVHKEATGKKECETAKSSVLSLRQMGEDILGDIRTAALKFLAGNGKKRISEVKRLQKMEQCAFRSCNDLDEYCQKCAGILQESESSKASDSCQELRQLLRGIVSAAVSCEKSASARLKSPSESESEKSATLKPAIAKRQTAKFPKSVSVLSVDSTDSSTLDLASDSESQEIIRGKRRKVRSKAALGSLKKANVKRTVSVLSSDSDSNPILELETDSSEDAPICRRKKKVAMAKRTAAKGKRVAKRSSATRPLDVGSANGRKRKAVSLSRGAAAAKRRRLNEAVSEMRRTEERRARRHLILAQRLGAPMAQRKRSDAKTAGRPMRDGILGVQMEGAGDGLSHTRAATSKTNAQFRAGARALIAAVPVPGNAHASCNGPPLVRTTSVTSTPLLSSTGTLTVDFKSKKVIDLGIIGETLGGLCETKLSPPPLESPETDTLEDTKSVSRMCESVVNHFLRSSPVQASNPVQVIGQELVGQRQEQTDLDERVSISRKDEEWTVIDGLLEVHKDAAYPPPTDPRTRGRSLTRSYIQQLGSTFDH